VSVMSLPLTQLPPRARWLCSRAMLRRRSLAYGAAMLLLAHCGGLERCIVLTLFMWAVSLLQKSLELSLDCFDDR
jgi:hypothetical protein